MFREIRTLFMPHYDNIILKDHLKRVYCIITKYYIIKMRKNNNTFEFGRV